MRLKLFFPEHIRSLCLLSLDRTPAVFMNHKMLQVDANYGTTGTMDARCSDRQGRTCIGFKVCIRFYWFRCVARHFAQNGNVTGCDQRCCCRVHRPNQFTSPSTYASLRSAICIFSSLIFIPFKLPQLSISHYCQLARRPPKASTPRMLHVTPTTHRRRG